MAVLLANTVFAQQKPQYTQYTQNNYLLNPAITGIEDYADVRLGSRHQWSGLEGAPVSYYASFHAPFMKDIVPAPRANMGGASAKQPNSKPTNVYRRVRPHHGIGGMAMTTRTGPLKRSSINASYAYHVPLTNSIRMSAGISPGLIQYSLDPNFATTTVANDPALYDGRVNETKFDLNMGLWLYSQQFFVGVAGAQLAPSKRQLIDTGQHEENSGALQKHYFVTGGYRLEVSPYLTLVPSVMVKMAQPSPVAVDVNAKAIYANRVWAGISYRHQDALAAMAGISVSALLDISYSYDATASPLAHTSSGSHEVILGFRLSNPNKSICPQWAW
jgi:type IX secretion system PorP/SprF family membrane protein